MSAKMIPSGPLAGAAGVPAPVLLAHVTVGVASQNPDVAVLETGAYTLFDVNESIAVLHLWTRVEEAFGGTVTVDIGDSDTAAKFISDTTLNSNATGAVLVADTGIGTLPIVYASAQDLLATIGGASVAAGLLHVYMQYVALED